MLRYLRSRIGSSYEVKVEHFDDFIDYKKLTTHGFPQKVSSISLDTKLGLIAIGTQDGRVTISNSNGSLISDSIAAKLPIKALYFVNGANRLMVFCEDYKTNAQFFWRCQIASDHLNFSCLKSDKHLKRITCCDMLDNETESALLIGTVIGNVYALWVQKLELVEYIIFQDAALKSISEIASHNQQKQINRIIVHPENDSWHFMMFNNSIVVLYDHVPDEVLRIHNSEKDITYFSSLSQSFIFFCSHNDGSYTVLDLSDNKKVERKNTYDGRKCTEITKIIASESHNGERFIIFAGGVPLDELGDHFTISIFCAEKSLILDCDSPILDFHIMKYNDTVHILFILCEDELTAIDLMDPLWRMVPLLQLYPLHYSPITCILAVNEISKNAQELLIQLAKEQRNSSQFSKNNLLKNGPDGQRTEHQELNLVITGHENGVVNLWMSWGIIFQHWLSLNTAPEFEGYFNQDEQSVLSHGNEITENKGIVEHNGLPPVRKAGFFDPFSDDQRLSVQKMFFDSITADFAIGGQAGQLLIYKVSGKKIIPPNEILLMDMTSSNLLEQSNNRFCYESAIQARRTAIKCSSGYCLINNTIAQFKPTVPITSIAWDHNSSIIAAGNEFGYAICSITRKEVLLIKTLISTADVVQISNMDGPLSRFKSVKKSIRRSFRKKKGQMAVNDDAHKTTHLHNTEREIVQRNFDPKIFDGGTPASLVKVAKFINCNLSTSKERHLFIGTHGGVVFIHAIRNSDINHSLNTDDNEQHIRHGYQCPLIKEIRLKHQAPIVAIECMSGTLFVFTEEQICTYQLPGLKPLKRKLRFTALEGLRIKKAGIVQLKSRIRRITSPENFVAVLTNRGEIFLFAANSTFKKKYRVQYAETADATAIISSAISNDGQLFYLNPRGSELERYSLNAALIYSKK